MTPIQTRSLTRTGILAMYKAPFDEVAGQYCSKEEHRPVRIGLKHAGLVFAILGRPTAYQEAWIGIPLACATWKGKVPRFKPSSNAPLLLVHRVKHGNDCDISCSFESGLTKYTVTQEDKLVFSLQESPGLSRPGARALLTLGNHPAAQVVKSVTPNNWPWHTLSFSQQMFRIAVP